jgi:hypothetical protein
MRAASRWWGWWIESGGIEAVDAQAVNASTVVGGSAAIPLKNSPGNLAVIT